MRLKVILAISAIGLLTACGKTVETPIETVEPVVEPIVEEEPEEVTEENVEEEEPTFEDATFVQMGEYEYTLYIDCPDNSDAPEIEETINRLGYDSWSDSCGVSANLVDAVLTHGVQIDYCNAAELDLDIYKGYVIKLIDLFGHDKEYTILGDFEYHTDETGITHVNLQDFCYDEGMQIPAHVCYACTVILKDSIRYTNGNITLALIRYHVGPEAFDELMQECVEATGLTEEEIYAHYGADFVYQYDTLGIGDANYANEVLQYVSGDIVITEYSGGWGEILSETTYTLVRP